MHRARDVLLARWPQPEDGPHVVSGKNLFAILSSWTQEHFGTSVSPSGVVRHLRPDDRCDELAAVVARIAQGHVGATASVYHSPR